MAMPTLGFLQVPVVKKKKEAVKAAAESSDDDLDDESEPSGDDTEEDEFKPAGAAAAAESEDEDSEAGMFPLTLLRTLFFDGVFTHYSALPRRRPSAANPAWKCHAERWIDSEVGAVLSSCAYKDMQSVVP